ncbi:MAG: hypothetical protein JNL81_07480 [Hyphomonadaceae bacterium]|nr:hypothetical protein [Hyphomonadaceae bacterium]
MNAPPSPDTLALTVPPALWRVAAAFMHILHSLFGTPGDLAGQLTLTLKAYQLTASWLRCGEAMMRRLLLIEAQSFAKSDTRTRPRASVRRTHKPPCRPEAPATWRVSFRCFAERHKQLRPDARQQTGDLESIRRRAPKTWRSSQALAERYEALLRAFNNPLALARRLARQLHATPQRAYRMLIAPPEARRRIDHYAELSAAAETSAALFNTS